MPDGIRWVGLDVHARASMVAVFDQATGEVLTRRVIGRPHELLPLLREISRPARMVYEAGPTGYGLARRARAEGIELEVCAPGRTERPPSDRVKTDKRDAIRLARLSAAGVSQAGFRGGSERRTIRPPERRTSPDATTEEVSE